MNERNNWDSHLNRIRSRIGLSQNKIRPALKHMNLQTRRTVITAKVKSIIMYGAPMILNQNQQTNYFGKQY